MIPEICGDKLNFLTALIAEFRAGSQLSLTIRASGWSLLGAALHTELRPGRVLMTTLRTRNTCLGRALRAALTSGLI